MLSVHGVLCKTNKILLGLRY